MGEMKVTVDRIMNLHPCYTLDRVEQLWAGRRSLTPTQIAKLDISHEDRVWALVRLVTRKAAVAWACDCASRVLSIWEAWAKGAKRPAQEIAAPRRCIRVTRLWLRGKATIAQIVEARNDAAAAAYAAYAADATAYATAAAYAADATAYAAYTAAYAAAYAAAPDAAAPARAKERAWQLERLVKYAERKVP
jgi:hypothetical protein